jgi:hypothetical protein
MPNEIVRTPWGYDCVLHEEPGLLVKILDVRGKLSLQLHPVKAEAWLVLCAYEGQAKVCYGSSGGGEQDLVWHDVRQGDVIMIPPGCLHTAWHCRLLELSDCLDVTYRLRDYEQYNRDTHVHQVQKVLDQVGYLTGEVIRKDTYRSLVDQQVLGTGSKVKLSRYALGVDGHGHRGLVVASGPHVHCFVYGGHAEVGPMWASRGWRLENEFERPTTGGGWSTRECPGAFGTQPGPHVNALVKCVDYGPHNPTKLVRDGTWMPQHESEEASCWMTIYGEPQLVFIENPPVGR